MHRWRKMKKERGRDGTYDKKEKSAEGEGKERKRGERGNRKAWICRWKRVK